MIRAASGVSALVMKIPQVADYLSSRLAAKVVVTSFKQSFPGLSRETYLIDARVNEQPRGFVLRVDPACGGCSPQGLRHEYEVYKRLWLSPVPVAEPLWYAEDIDFAEGRPHMVRDKVDGVTTPPGLSDRTSEGATLRRKLVRDHVEHLAELHLLDWRKYGFDQFIAVPEQPSQSLRLEFDYWKSLWIAGRTEPYPLITEALYWLEEQMPTDTPFVSLVKGNNGVGEEIFRDGRIVAMSDWELTSLGDGALDLGFSQGTLALDDFNAAIRYYGECTGQEVSPQRIAFAMFWIMFKAIVCLNTLFLRRYLAGTDSRISSPAFGLLTVRQYEQRLATGIGKDIVTALGDLNVQGQKSTYAQIGEDR